MLGRKIYINESLPHDKFQIFKSLKPIALGLGFKYVWKIVPEDLTVQLSCCDWTPFDVDVIDTEQALDCLCVNLSLHP